MNYQEKFFKAIDDGNTEAVKSYISCGADVNAFQYAFSALYIAIMQGNMAIIRLLIDSGANVNIVEGDNRTPIYHAIEESSIDILQVLIDSKADVNFVDNSDSTPLHCAAHSLKMVQILIKAGACVDVEDTFHRSPLYYAAEFGRIDVVNYLINEGANIDLGWPPHIIAAERGHSKVVEVLIEAGANVNAKDHIDWAALHRAAENGHTVVVEFLIAAEADVNAKNKRQQTPLHLAASNGHTVVIEVLIAAGADVNAVDDKCVTLLYNLFFDDLFCFLSDCRRLEIAQFLIRNGAIIDEITTKKLLTFVKDNQNGINLIRNRLIIQVNKIWLLIYLTFYMTISLILPLLLMLNILSFPYFQITAGIFLVTFAIYMLVFRSCAKGVKNNPAFNDTRYLTYAVIFMHILAFGVLLLMTFIDLGFTFMHFAMVMSFLETFYISCRVIADPEFGVALRILFGSLSVFGLALLGLDIFVSDLNEIKALFLIVNVLICSMIVARAFLYSEKSIIQKGAARRAICMI